MVICQFFLQGRCRYGQNCRFEHSYNNDDRSNKNIAGTQQLSNVIKQIADQVILAEEGGQWPLSCFSPIKEGPNIPGWEDVSPEEVRWKMYEARSKGTLNQCINEINQLYDNAKKNRNMLKQPTMEKINLIVNMLKAKKDIPNTSNIFSNSGQSSGLQRNIFGGEASTIGSQGNIFGGASLPLNQGNIFNNTNQSFKTQANIFGGSTTFSNQAVFADSNSPNNFNQNAFGSPQAVNKNIFSGTPPVGGGNIFSNAQTSFSFAQPVMQSTTQNVFSASNTSGVFSNKSSNASIFGSPNAALQYSEKNIPNQSNIYGAGQTENVFKSQNIFGKTDIINSQQTSKNVFQEPSTSSVNNRPLATDSTVYSKVSDLSEEEIKSFTAATFTLGKIPLKPPPQEYCN